MPDPCTYDYGIVRVVPRVERGEFVNVGAIVSSDARSYLKAGFDLDEARLRSLDGEVDIAAVRDALASIATVCLGGAAAGPIGLLPLRERFHWLVAPRSTSVQVSAVHTGRCDDLDAALESLLRKMVRMPASRPGRTGSSGT